MDHSDAFIPAVASYVRSVSKSISRGEPTQRSQALWAAWKFIKPFVLPAVIALLGGYLKALQHAELSTVFLFSVYGFAGGLFILGGLRGAFGKGFTRAGHRPAQIEILESRLDLSSSVGTLEDEIKQAERVWLMCPCGMQLQAIDGELLQRIDRLILARPSKEDEHDEAFISYAHMLGDQSLVLRQKIAGTKHKFDQLDRRIVRYLIGVPIGVFVGNPNADSGWARLELIVPGGVANQRINLVVRRRDKKELFDRIVSSFEKTWTALRDDDALYVQTSAPSSYIRP